MDVYDKLVFLFVVHILQEFATVATSIDECPASHHHVETYGDYCYMFVNSEKYWDVARSYCWKMGGEMLFVENHFVMEFIKKVLNSRELNWSNNGVWLGASDLRDKGWEWTTGKKLTYTYWAPGEPGKFLPFLSLENCACMRRSDNWRWHDYHCHMPGFEYKFICQIPKLNTLTDAGPHTNTGAPLQKERDDRLLVIVLIMSGIGLLIVISAVVYCLYRKQQQQKREHQKSTQRFQNTGYATIMQEISHDRSNDYSSDSGIHVPLRPVSNIYLDPVEINRPPVYSEVDSNASVTEASNSLPPVSSSTQQKSDVQETERLVYTGGASSAGNLATVGLSLGTPSEASGATSGYCSRRSGESEYVEMSGGNSMASLSGLSSGSQSVGASTDNLKNCKGGATGSLHDLKSSNMYVTPIFCDSNTSSNGNSKSKEKVQPEIHIYSNRLEEIENNSLKGIRPLPPLPLENSSVRVENVV